MNIFKDIWQKIEFKWKLYKYKCSLMKFLKATKDFQKMSEKYNKITYEYEKASKEFIDYLRRKNIQVEVEVQYVDQAKENEDIRYIG